MRPLSKDLQEFIRLRAAESVEYLMVGAWAVAFHGRPRYTGDLDIFLRLDPANAERMMRIIEAFGFGATGITREDFLKENYVIQFSSERRAGASPLKSRPISRWIRIAGTTWWR